MRISAQKVFGAKIAVNLVSVLMVLVVIIKREFVFAKLAFTEKR